MLIISVTAHYENMPMRYTAIFHGYKSNNFQMKNCVIFLIFAQNIDRGYTEAVLTSTHDLCFRVKIRKNVHPCKPQLFFIKVGCKGVYITRTCLHDDIHVARYSRREARSPIK